MNDSRNTSRGNLRHQLVDIMFLAISAAVCGLTDWVDVEEFGKGQLSWLRKYFPFKNGIPSHDTLGRVFAQLDTAEFSRCFTDWVNHISTFTQGQLIAVDGKRLRGSYDKTDNKSALHMVSAYATMDHLCLQQVAVSEKSNEITAIPQLLDLLTITGCTISIDAMGCQRDICAKIVDKQADYIVGLKANQKGMLQQVEKLFKITAIVDEDQANDLGHGRIETRTCQIITDLTHFDDYKDWPGITSLIRIMSKRVNKSTGKVEEQTRHYISSKNAPASHFNNEIRNHWSIENKLHWSLDVNFGEDQSRKRKGNAPYNANLLYKIALGLIEKNDSKLPKSRQRTKAAFDPKFREKILRI